MPRPAPPIADAAEVLVLQLGHAGDLLTSRPALFDLRSALPAARILLAMAPADVVPEAPVDEVLVFRRPWSAAWKLRPRGLDLAIDLQGTLRSALLLRLSGARRRVGGSEVAPSPAEAKRAVVARATGVAPEGPAALLRPEERDFARHLYVNLSLEDKRPVVAVHLGTGGIESWAALLSRLQEAYGANIVVTGAAEAGAPAVLVKKLPRRGIDLTGRLKPQETLSVVERADLVLTTSADAAHRARALGVPVVAPPQVDEAFEAAARILGAHGRNA
jgi:heptosyltransferase-1